MKWLTRYNGSWRNDCPHLRRMGRACWAVVRRARRVKSGAGSVEGIRRALPSGWPSLGEVVTSMGVGERMDEGWAVKLFRKSIMKQQKFSCIVDLLSETNGLHCLDLGSDNGVISYLLRERGGSWKTADLDEESVQATRELVQRDVFQIDGLRTPFEDNEFDLVVIVDLLEHIEADRAFVGEVFRILKPGGELIVNVPNARRGIIRKLRNALGDTDEKHGHVRAGYTVDELKALLKDRFSVIIHRYYSKFFSEVIDTLLRFAVDRAGAGKMSARKGPLVRGEDLRRSQTAFRLYSLIYPIVWSFAKLDRLLVWCDGYGLICKAVSAKR